MLKTLKDLAIALLNATLVLAIALAVSLIVLLGKAGDFRDETAAMLAPQAQRLERIATALEQIRDNTSSEQTAAEVEETLADLPDLSGLENMTIRSVVEEALHALGEWLSKASLGDAGEGAP